MYTVDVQISNDDDDGDVDDDDHNHVPLHAILTCAFGEEALRRAGIPNDVIIAAIIINTIPR